MSQQHFYQKFEPERCWVGDQQKICYKTKDEAEVAAACAEYDHDAPQLSVYKCKFGNHWHLTRKEK